MLRKVEEVEKKLIDMPFCEERVVYLLLASAGKNEAHFPTKSLRKASKTKLILRPIKIETSSKDFEKSGKIKVHRRYKSECIAANTLQTIETDSRFKLTTLGNSPEKQGNGQRAKQNVNFRDLISEKEPDLEEVSGRLDISMITEMSYTRISKKIRAFVKLFNLKSDNV